MAKMIDQSLAMGFLGSQNHTVTVNPSFQISCRPPILLPASAVACV